MDNSQIIAQHKQDKKTSVDFKQRRFEQWNDNYYLYRDKVITNRLTQRQSINVPIMRETIQTWISKIDEAPQLVFESRSKGNKSEDGEIVMNEIWSYYFDKLKLDLVDNLDKKIVGLQGRSFKLWGWANNEIFCDILDPYDVEVDPNCNPLDLDSASYFIRKNIFRPIRDVLANKLYDQEELNVLKTYMDSTKGLFQADQTRDEFFMRQERLRTLGAYNFDTLGATDFLVELNESYRMLWNKDLNRFVRHKIVIAGDCAVLYNKPLKEAIGIERLPIVSWADDPDLNDLWCDGKGDSVRTFNKVVNAYISQDLENRTYRNFGMYFYDTMNGTFQPGAFDPKPFGMFGVPGNPDQVVKQVRIEPLQDTAQQITFLKDLIQSSVAQTPTERGIASKGSTTLGEVQLNLQQSSGRNEVTAKNYRRAWKESGEIVYALLEANSKGAITLYKKGGDGQYHSKDVFPSDWINPKGYECKVIIKADKDAQDNLALQKISFIQKNSMNNPVAQKLAKRKELEILGWTPDEIQQVMQFEEQPAPTTTTVDPNNPNPNPSLDNKTLPVTLGK